jgi:hypothetical protein
MSLNQGIAELPQKTIHPPKKMWPVSHKELQEKNLLLMSEVEKLWTESDLHKLDPPY